MDEGESISCNISAVTPARNGFLTHKRRDSNGQNGKKNTTFSFDDAMLVSGRRARRYKPVDVTKELVVLIPGDDPIARFGVGSREAEDLLISLDEVVEYHEDSDGDVQPLAFVSPLLAATRATINISKIVHTPRVALSSDTTEQTVNGAAYDTYDATSTSIFTLPQKLTSTSATPDKPIGYRETNRHSFANRNRNPNSQPDSHPNSPRPTLKSASPLPTLSGYQDYDCDPTDWLFVRTINATVSSSSLRQPKLSRLSRSAFEQMIALLEQQLEWTYGTMDSVAAAQDILNRCERSMQETRELTTLVEAYLAQPDQEQGQRLFEDSGHSLTAKKRKKRISTTSLTALSGVESPHLLALDSFMTRDQEPYVSSSLTSPLLAADVESLFVAEAPMSNPYLPISRSRGRRRGPIGTLSAATPVASVSTIPGASAEDSNRILPVTNEYNCSASIPSLSLCTHTFFQSQPHSPIIQSIECTPRDSLNLPPTQRRDWIHVMVPLSKSYPALQTLLQLHTDDGIEPELSSNTQDLRSKLRNVLGCWIDGPFELLTNELLRNENGAPDTTTSPIDNQSALEKALLSLVYAYWSAKRASRRTSLLRAYHRFSMRSWSRPQLPYPFVFNTQTGDDRATSLGSERQKLTLLLGDLDKARTLVDRVRRREKIKRDLLRITQSAQLILEDLPFDEKGLQSSSHAPIKSGEKKRRLSASTSHNDSVSSAYPMVKRGRSSKPRQQMLDHVNIRNNPLEYDSLLFPPIVSAQSTSTKVPLTKPTTKIIRPKVLTAALDEKEEKELIQTITDRLLLTGVALYGVGQYQDIRERYGNAFNGVSNSGMSLRFLFLCRHRRAKQPIEDRGWPETSFAQSLSTEERYTVFSFNEDKIWDSIFVRYLSGFQGTQQQAIRSPLRKGIHSIVPAADRTNSVLAELIPARFRDGRHVAFRNLLLLPSMQPPYHAEVDKIQEVENGIFENEISMAAGLAADPTNQIGRDESPVEAVQTYIPLKERIKVRKLSSSEIGKGVIPLVGDGVNESEVTAIDNATSLGNQADAEFVRSVGLSETRVGGDSDHDDDEIHDSSGGDSSSDDDSDDNDESAEDDNVENGEDGTSGSLSVATSDEESTWVEEAGWEGRQSEEERLIGTKLANDAGENFTTDAGVELSLNTDFEVAKMPAAAGPDNSVLSAILHTNTVKYAAVDLVVENGHKHSSDKLGSRVGKVNRIKREATRCPYNDDVVGSEIDLNVVEGPSAVRSTSPSNVSHDPTSIDMNEAAAMKLQIEVETLHNSTASSNNGRGDTYSVYSAADKKGPLAHQIPAPMPKPVPIPTYGNSVQTSSLKKVLMECESFPSSTFEPSSSGSSDGAQGPSSFASRQKISTSSVSQDHQQQLLYGNALKKRRASSGTPLCSLFALASATTTVSSVARAPSQTLPHSAPHMGLSTKSARLIRPTPLQPSSNSSSFTTRKVSPDSSVSSTEPIKMHNSRKLKQSSQLPNDPDSDRIVNGETWEDLVRLFPTSPTPTDNGQLTGRDAVAGLSSNDGAGSPKLSKVAQYEQDLINARLGIKQPSSSSPPQAVAQHQQHWPSNEEEDGEDMRGPYRRPSINSDSKMTFRSRTLLQDSDSDEDEGNLDLLQSSFKTGSALSSRSMKRDSSLSNSSANSSGSDSQQNTTLILSPSIGKTPLVKKLSLSTRRPVMATIVAAAKEQQKHL